MAGVNSYVGTIALFAGKVLPKDWLECNGNILGVLDYPLLYGIIGNTFGGDISYFNLPDLRGRVPLGASEKYIMGISGGSETVQIKENHLPEHNHKMFCDSAPGKGVKISPEGNIPAPNSDDVDNYLHNESITKTNGKMALSMVNTTGNGVAHNNMQPFNTLKYIIRVNGEKPPFNNDEILHEAIDSDTKSYTGIISYFGGNYIPKGWLNCNGLKLEKKKYEKLFNVIGNQFGGDGKKYFCLPDLLGRVAVGEGTNPGLTPRKMGETGGEYGVVLAPHELPAHSHEVQCEINWLESNHKLPEGNFPAPNFLGEIKRAKENLNYGTNGKTKLMMESILEKTKSQAHENRMPFLPLNFIICADGE